MARLRENGHHTRSPVIEKAAAMTEFVTANVRLSSLANSQGDGYYSRAAADVLSEDAAWSYSDSKTLVDALRQRAITGESTECYEVSVCNEPMLVVGTAYFIREGSVGVLCFRGTEPQNAINFLTDANVQTKNFLALGRVHGGFFRNVRALWPELKSRVDDAISDSRTPLRNLYITGHSLGGAMAVVAAGMIFGAAEHEKWRPLVRGIYTYGQPMVGDQEFARSCDARFGAKLFRHIYDHDFVPRLPPITTGEFVHFGSEYLGNLEGWEPRSPFITQAASVVATVVVGTLAWTFLQIPVLSKIRLPYSLNDHSPNSYLEAFRAARC